MTLEELEVIEKHANKVCVGDAEYYYMPYWFKADKSGVTKHTFDNLPQELKDYVRAEREKKIERVPLYDKPIKPQHPSTFAELKINIDE